MSADHHQRHPALLMDIVIKVNVPTLSQNPRQGWGTLCRRCLVFLSQARERCQLLQVLSQRLRGSSPERHAFAAENLVRQNSALAAQHDTLANRCVFADADLSAENHGI